MKDDDEQGAYHHFSVEYNPLARKGELSAERGNRIRLKSSAFPIFLHLHSS